ncbi:MAG TPA: RNA-binding protein [Methylomirabilota bacterium]|nr:RNA-binding protein [Methylomirabilota bacterium]
MAAAEAVGGEPRREPFGERHGSGYNALASGSTSPSQPEERAPLLVAVGVGPGRRGTISAKIFVGNLSYQTSRDELTRLLSEVGNVVDAYLPSDRETGRPRGFAFVTFATEEEAAQAIQRFNGREVDGRKLVVNAAEARPPRRADGAGPPPRMAGPPPPPDVFGGGGGREARGRPFKAKGSRRGLRGRKRSL